MRNWIAFLLLAFYLGMAFKPLVVLSDYAWNYREYREVKCENRDQPEKGCYGTCQLGAKLGLAAKTQAPPALPFCEGLYFYQAILPGEVVSTRAIKSMASAFPPHLSAPSSLKIAIEPPPPQNG